MRRVFRKPLFRQVLTVLCLMSLSVVFSQCGGKPELEKSSRGYTMVDGRWLDIGVSPADGHETKYIDRQLITSKVFTGAWIKTVYNTPPIVVKRNRDPAHIEERFYQFDCENNKVYATGTYNLYDLKNKKIAFKGSPRRAQKPLKFSPQVLKITQYVCSTVKPPVVPAPVSAADKIKKTDKK